MNRPKQESAALTAGGAVAGPYTDHDDRRGEVVNGSAGAAIRALDRKLTDGLNLVHGQFAVLREERREDRQELRALRIEIREDRKELKAELRVEIREDRQKLKAELREDRQKLAAELRAEIAGVDNRVAALEDRVAALENRVAALETAIRELTGQVSTALERGFGTRRLVWGVFGALGLLILGGMIRPLVERAVSVLFGG